MNIHEKKMFEIFDKNLFKSDEDIFTSKNIMNYIIERYSTSFSFNEKLDKESIEFLTKYSDKIKWKEIKTYFHPENLIKLAPVIPDDDLNFLLDENYYNYAKADKFFDVFFIENKDRLNPFIALMKYPPLEYIEYLAKKETYKEDETFWKLVSAYGRLNKEFILKYKDKIDFVLLNSNKAVSIKHKTDEEILPFINSAMDDFLLKRLGKDIPDLESIRKLNLKKSITDKDKNVNITVNVLLNSYAINKIMGYLKKHKEFGNGYLAFIREITSNTSGYIHIMSVNELISFYSKHKKDIFPEHLVTGLLNLVNYNPDEYTEKYKDRFFSAFPELIKYFPSIPLKYAEKLIEHTKGVYLVYEIQSALKKTDPGEYTAEFLIKYKKYFYPEDILNEERIPKDVKRKILPEYIHSITFSVSLNPEYFFDFQNNPWEILKDIKTLTLLSNAYNKYLKQHKLTYFQRFSSQTERMAEYLEKLKTEARKKENWQKYITFLKTEYKPAVAKARLAETLNAVQTHLQIENIEQIINGILINRQDTERPKLPFKDV